MNYQDFLETVDTCPFCNFSQDNTIEKRDNVFSTFAIAPYSKNHLLIVPYRHIESFEDLNDKEKKEIDELLISSIKSLKKLGHKDYSILLRNGQNLGKSIEHLHYHLIPSVEIGSLSNNHVEREIITESEQIDLLNKFRNKNHC